MFFSCLNTSLDVIGANHNCWGKLQTSFQVFLKFMYNQKHKVYIQYMFCIYNPVQTSMLHEVLGPCKQELTRAPAGLQVQNVLNVKKLKKA